MAKYEYVRLEDDKEVTLELDPAFVWENQKGLFLNYDEKMYRRNIKKEIFGEKKSKTTGGDRVGPIKRVSSAAGVHPLQVAEARDHYSGVHPGISFHQNGDVEFSSRGARKAFLKAANMRDNNGGYGD